MGWGIQNQGNSRKFGTSSVLEKRLRKDSLLAQFNHDVISKAAYELNFCYCYQLQAERIPSCDCFAQKLAT